MPLPWRFSLFQISYEVSKKLSDSAYLKLGNNPWLCSCLGGSPTPRKVKVSQIFNKYRGFFFRSVLKQTKNMSFQSFILKAVDLQDVYCGPQSENKEFANRKVIKMSP